MANNNRVFIYSTIFILAVLLGIVILALSLKRLTETQFGLEYDRIAKILDDAAQSGGLHIGPPGFKFVKFPSTFIMQELPEDVCVSQDGLRVRIKVAFEYQMPEEWLYEAVVRYRNFEKWQAIVTAAGRSGVQHSCSLFTISQYQNKRGLIQADMEDQIRLKLEGPPNATKGEGGVYARLVSVQLSNIAVPDEYKEAVAEKQSAEEDILLAVNQRGQETTKANTELKGAQEEAVKIFDSAKNDAEVLLTEANLKAEETAFIYEREAQVLLNIKNAMSLTNVGLLAYISNQFYGRTKDLKVSMLEPVKSSFNDEL